MWGVGKPQNQTQITNILLEGGKGARDNDPLTKKTLLRPRMTEEKLGRRQMTDAAGGGGARWTGLIWRKGSGASRQGRMKPSGRWEASLKNIWPHRVYTLTIWACSPSRGQLLFIVRIAFNVKDPRGKYQGSWRGALSSKCGVIEGGEEHSVQLGKRSKLISKAAAYQQLILKLKSAVVLGKRFVSQRELESSF